MAAAAAWAAKRHGRNENGGENLKSAASRSVEEMKEGGVKAGGARRRLPSALMLQ